MYSIDLREQYKRVIMWNQKVGKLPNPVTQLDIYSQQQLVEEEVQEWQEELVKEEKDINLLKELCDVFVVSCYLDFLQLMEVDEEVSLDLASEVMKQVWCDEVLEGMTEKTYLEYANNLKDIGSLKVVLVGTKESYIDIEGAIDEVLDNNDLKVYDTISEADEQLLLLGDDSKYFVDCNTLGGRDYFCIKRIEDRKVMKAINHPKVDLTKFVKGGE